MDQVQTEISVMLWFGHSRNLCPVFSLLQVFDFMHFLLLHARDCSCHIFSLSPVFVVFARKPLSSMILVLPVSVLRASEYLLPLLVFVSLSLVIVCIKMQYHAVFSAFSDHGATPFARSFLCMCVQMAKDMTDYMLQYVAAACSGKDRDKVSIHPIMQFAQVHSKQS